MEIMLSDILFDHITMKSVHILGRQSQFRNIFNDVVSQLPSISWPPLALFRIINDPFQAAAAKRRDPKRPSLSPTSNGRLHIIQATSSMETTPVN